MYSPKIDPDQVARLYRLKISLLAQGEKGITMTALVKTAVERFLDSEEAKIRAGRDRGYSFLVVPKNREGELKLKVASSQK